MNKTFVLLKQLFNFKPTIIKQEYELKNDTNINNKKISKYHSVSYEELRENTFVELFLEEKFNKVQEINLVYSEIQTLLYLKEDVSKQLVQKLKESLEKYERIDWPAVKSVTKKATPTRTVLTHFNFIKRTLQMSHELYSDIKQTEMARAQEIYTMVDIRKRNIVSSWVPSMSM
ncbi:MAG TPA: hypothetical protein PKJ33_00670 [Alphaproteobacteria bacterium]|nr:hypothetical protein [Alphaproteobacteria bacterium]